MRWGSRSGSSRPAATWGVYETAEISLLTKVDSWFMGVNQNLPEKKPTFMAYLGGSPAYRERCDDEAATGYAGFELA